MGKFLKEFQNHSDYQAFIEGGVVKPNVSYCVTEVDVHYNPKEHDYSQDYLTFVAREDGTFKFEGNNIKYSIDDGDTWTELMDGTNTPTVTSGTKIMWKASGLTNTYVPVGGEFDPETGEPVSEEIGIGHFLSTGQYDVEGNIMSLVYEDNFIGNNDLTLEWGEFYYLFYNNVDLINAKNLSLPATTLSASCYSSMFSNCTSLVSVPKLPATTLADWCYADMFASTNVLPDCSNIDFSNESTVASGGLARLFSSTKVTDQDLMRILPKDSNNRYCLPATTLTENCYYGMFYGCASLTTAPELPATTLVNQCYQEMFRNCTNLTTAPQLLATTLADNCYYGMFHGCTSLTTAPELPATTLVTSCYGGMFYGCTSLTTAPELLATTLANECYSSMFYGCTSLNYIKAMFTTTPSTTYTYGWVNGVASSGTFVKNNAATWNVNGINGIPTGWTVETANA